jgi:predicted AAA+ superfamily ATPase
VSPDIPLLEVLEDQNPWWRSAAERRALSYPFRRDLERQVVARVLRLGDRRATLVAGPRQVGKTVLLLQTADDLLDAGWPPGNLAYFDFSDDRLLAQAHPRQIIEARPAAFNPDHPRALLFDEISLAPQWDRWLKQAVDSASGARIVATDSAAVLLRAGGRESGQGRWDELPVEGLSLAEFVGIQAEPGESPAAGLRRSPVLVERYLAVGGFPEHARATDLPDVWRRLRGDIADRAIRRDLSREDVDVERVGRLFAYLVESSGSIFKAPERARDLGADPRSIRGWVDLLVDTRLLVPLERSHGRAAARLRSEPKIYGADPGLVAAFAPDAEAEPVRGRLFEAAVFRHLREAARALEGQVEYFRSHDGLELDFVLTSRKESVGIEVKSAARIRPEEVRRMRDAGSAAGVDRLLLVHGGAVSDVVDGIPRLALATFLLDPLAALGGEGGR